ncbi:sarcosine oxidase subunit gamma family protein [Nitratireductor sp. ZSWI3]|uniref:sarcosine oxidase subunit gamma family protein n=1 Tax=Nitratireductor sp. ZSWI3 TaxID=2966359 RepID=UPI00214F9A1B|nr:sarcosine oxidase subunit gamma family protein [Nitratireductor sp. ZSWI3]MCR4267731.1 sarcosine oxidase subunit gamma [Nitratireductor sp. ZSWI3]
MVERATPLGTDFRPGSYGDIAGGVGVTLSAPPTGTIVEATAWPGRDKALATALGKAAGLTLQPAPGSGAFKEGKAAAFVIGPGRFLVSGKDEALSGRLTQAVDPQTGTATDLSHGRTALRIEGPAAEWVLAKLFALDFSQAAFPVSAGRATAHHDVFAQIQRTGESRFDLYVFRSLARAFSGVLRHAAEEAGYTIR